MDTDESYETIFEERTMDPMDMRLGASNWCIRSVSRAQQSTPLYWDEDSTNVTFTIKMYYGGQITSDGYIGGYHQFVDFCKIDKIDLQELMKMSSEMGLFGTKVFYHRCKGKGCRVLNTNKDVKQIRSFVPWDREVEIYIDVIQGTSTVANFDENDDGDSGGDNDQDIDTDSEDSDYVQSFHDSAYEEDMLDYDAYEEEEVTSKKRNAKVSKKGKEKVVVENEEEELNEYDLMNEQLRRTCKNLDGDEPHWPEFNPKIDMADPKFEVGLLFSNNVIFKEAVLTHAVLSGRGSIYLKKNESYRVKYGCQEGCPWKITAMKMQHEDTLQVKRYIKEHTCNRECENKHVKSTWLAKRCPQEFKRQPDMPVPIVIEMVWNVLVLKITPPQALRTRKKALATLQGDLLEQYPLLYNYVEELKIKNPRSTVDELVTDTVGGKRRFKRLYICLGGLREGFKHCRPVIGVDRTFLKSNNGGVLLTAVGIDSNNNMFPLAYAVVEGETKDTWQWFLELLKDDVNIGNEHGWTFISDKQKGLVKAFEIVVLNYIYVVTDNLYTIFYTKVRRKQTVETSQPSQAHKNGKDQGNSTTPVLMHRAGIPNPRGWLLTGVPQTTSSFKGTPLILKNNKNYVSQKNLASAIKDLNSQGKQLKARESSKMKSQEGETNK